MMSCSYSWSPCWIRLPMWFNARIDRLCGTQHGIHERFQDTQTQLRITHHPQGTYERWDFSFSIYKKVFRLVIMSTSVMITPLCNGSDVTHLGLGGVIEVFICKFFCYIYLDITKSYYFLQLSSFWQAFLMTLHLHGQSSLGHSLECESAILCLKICSEGVRDEELGMNDCRWHTDDMIECWKDWELRQPSDWWRNHRNAYQTQFESNAVVIIRTLLTHCGQVIPYGDIYLAQHWFR